MYFTQAMLRLFNHSASIANRELSHFTSDMKFSLKSAGLRGLILLFFNLPFFESVLQSAPKVERSNVSCKASGQFWLMHRGATKFPCVQIPFLALLSFNQGEERDQDWSLNGFSTIPSTKVFWSKGLNKSTKNMNRNNKYQNQHVID